MFNGASVAYALKMHLTAIDRFEKQNKAKKVIKHMGGLKKLLVHQNEDNLISNHAYDAFYSYAERLVKQFIGVYLNKEQINVTEPENFPVTLLLENNTNESMDIAIETDSPEGITLELEQLVQISAGEKKEIEGDIHVSEALPAGEHAVKIHLLVEGNKVITNYIFLRVQNLLLFYQMKALLNSIYKKNMGVFRKREIL